MGKSHHTAGRIPSWERLWRGLEGRSGYLLAVMLILFFALFSLAAVRKYELFRMGFDVALIHQAVWNTIQGRFLETHAYDFTNSLLGVDSLLMAAWLSPLYALFPSVYTLLIAQIAIVTLGALPLYWLTRERLGGAAGLLVAAAYLLYPPVEYGSLYEIRLRIMAMAWLGFLFLFVERRTYWAMWPFLFLALSCRLDATIAVAMVGLYAFLRRRPWYYGTTLLLAGLGWYLAMTQAIIPSLSTRSGYMFLEHYRPLGSTLGEILRTAVTQPGLVLQIIFQPAKVWYLFQMGLPLLFTPLLAPQTMVPVLPLFLLNLLSSRSIQFDIYHHYQGPITVFLMVGTILAWETAARAGDRSRAHLRIPLLGWWSRLGRENRIRLFGLALLAASLACNLAFRNPLPSIFFGRAPERTATARSLIARIPPDVPVAASNLLSPFIPMRRDIFLVPGGAFHYAEHPEERADYILLDLQSEFGEEERALLERLRAQPAWEVLAEQDGYVLLMRRP
ncbi:MAG: DUF2079 domain-containing protein [Chloroflexia bacterium]